MRLENENHFEMKSFFTMNRNKNENDFDKWSNWTMKVVSVGVKISQVFGLRRDVIVKK